MPLGPADFKQIEEFLQSKQQPRPAGFWLRPSAYGANLRGTIEVEKPPWMRGVGQGGGVGRFHEIWVEVLHVTKTLEIRDNDIEIDAGKNARIGTLKGFNWSQKSNDITRFQVLSGGALAFVSAELSATFANPSYTDTFNRANESPVTAWTATSAGMFYQVSANALHTSAVSAAALGRAHRSDTGAYQQDGSVQADLNGVSSVGVNSTRQGVFFRETSAAGQLAIGAILDSGLSSVRLDYISAGKFLISNPAAATDLTIYSPGTLKLVGSGTTVAAYWNGVFSVSAAMSAQAGYGGVFILAADTVNYHSWDNFQVLGDATPPFSAQDVLFQASATLYTILGPDQATRWGHLYNDSIQLGDKMDVLVIGTTNRFEVSAGTSAFLPATTYGVTRLISAGGTAGLSGVVGLSGVGLTISAVGNDVLISAGPNTPASATWAVSAGVAVSALSATQWAASATWATSASFATSAASAVWASAVGFTQSLWGFRNLRGSNLDGVSASANFWLASDEFRVITTANDLFVGTALAVSANINAASVSAGTRDAGIPTASWAHLYVISGSNGVNAIWSSSHPSAGPVFPAGYKAYAYATTVFYDSASALFRMRLRGDSALYHVAGNHRVLSNGGAAVETAVSLSGHVPPIALMIPMVGTGVFQNTGLASITLYYGHSSGADLTEGGASGYFFQNYQAEVVNTDIWETNSFPLPNHNQFGYYFWSSAFGTRGLYWDVMGYSLPNGAV